MRRTAIAIIIPGGIGTGTNNIGVPVLERIVKLLAREFDLTVFSLFRINPDYRAADFELIPITGSNAILKMMKLFTIFRKQHRVKKFKAIHGFWALPSGLYALILGKLFRIKSIVNILGGDAISLPEIGYGQLQKVVSRKMILWTLTNANEVVLLTRYLLSNLNRAGLPKRNIKIIPWGIDMDVFRYHEKAIGSPVEFLHIGNLFPVKDQRTLLKAFKIIRSKIPARLTLIGEGILENDLKMLVLDLGISDDVIFQKPMAYEQLADFYRKADVLLHTSLSEGQSEVVTEAMSSGVVVCGTNVGLIFDQPECCTSVAVGDFEALGKEVLALLENEMYLAEIRNRAYQWASTHSIHWTVEQIAILYRHDQVTPNMTA